MAMIGEKSGEIFGYIWQTFPISDVVFTLFLPSLVLADCEMLGGEAIQSLVVYSSALIASSFFLALSLHS